jgi:L-cysteine desulfidase
VGSVIQGPATECVVQCRAAYHAIQEAMSIHQVQGFACVIASPDVAAGVSYLIQGKFSSICQKVI